MARLLFPDAASVDRVQATAGTSLLSASGASMVVYLDEAGTQLADIQTPAGAAIAGSSMVLDSLSRIPTFLGPTSGADVLYVRVDGGAPLMVEATLGQRFESFKTTERAYGGTAYVVTAGGSTVKNPAGSTTPGVAVENRATAGTAYAVDVKVFPTAIGGVVVHNYSGSLPAAVGALQVDSTNASPLLVLKNTNNETISPGTFGTGDFLHLYGNDGAGATILYSWITSGHQWNVRKTLTLSSQVSGVKTLQVNNAQGGVAAAFARAGTGASSCVTINQDSPGEALTVVHNGAAHGLHLVGGVGSAGFFPVLVETQDFAAKFQTSANGGDTVTVAKNGTGAGAALKVDNRGTGVSVDVRSAAGQVLAVLPAGQVYMAKASAPVASGLGGYLYVDAGGALRYRGPTTDSLVAAA